MIDTGTVHSIQQIDRPLLIESLLSIDNKSGFVVPFKFNRGQAYFSRNKSSRNIILKHRQGGWCVDPNTPVLTSDLLWKPIKDILVGDRLISFDEQDPKGKGNSRKYRESTVLSKTERIGKAYLIETSSGNLIASGEHKFFARRKSGYVSSWRSITAKGKTKLKVGCKLQKLVNVWGDSTFEDGWFGGFIDGEGSLGKRRAQLKVTQKPGLTMDRCIRYINSYGKSYYSKEPGHYPGSTGADSITIFGIAKLFEVFGKCRPTRFLNRKDWWEGKEITGKGKAKWVVINSITELPNQELIDIETSEGTFIANGFASHNSSSILADMFIDCITMPHAQCAVVSHETRATQRLLDRVQFYYDTMPPPKPSLGAESRTEKTFPDLHSSIYIGTAGCLHPDSAVLIEGGNTKAIKDVQIGDNIYCGRGRNLQTVDQLIINPYSGKMLRMTIRGNPSESLIVTPDHKFMVHKRWNRADKIVSPLNSKGKRVCYFIKPIHSTIKNIDGIPTDYDLGWVFGLYMAEGWYGGAYTNFALNLNETDLSQKIKLFAEEHKFSFRSRQVSGIGDNGMEISIGSAPFMRTIERLFGKKKTVPDWFWDCGIDFLNGVIDGYVAGDGSEQENKTKVTSVRPHLLYQLRDMLLSARGIYSGIYKLNPREGFGGIQKIQWELDFPLIRGIKFHKCRKSSKGKQFYNWVSIPIKFEEIDYTGFVYDISCGGSFSTPSCLVHNSRAFGRGDTIRKALLSELAFYEDARSILNAVEDAVPMNGELTIESTPNGEDSVYYEEWVRAREGKSPYKPFFFPWWWTADYQIAIGNELALPEDRGELHYTGEELDLVERFKVTESQIRWRRWKIAEKQGLFYQEYPEDELTCFITIGDPVFDNMRLTNLAQGCYEGTKHEDGWTFWMPPEPKLSYTVGVDTSAGAPGGSYSAFAVLNSRWEVCATFQGRVEPHILASILKKVGKFYNNAELAIERNFTGYAVIGHLTDYPNIYLQRDFTTGKITSTKGWWTNEQTKHYMMTAMKDHLDMIKIWDMNLIRQLRSYRYIKFLPTAQTFDDLAMATMIAVAVRKVVGVSKGYQGATVGWSWD